MEKYGFKDGKIQNDLLIGKIELNDKLVSFVLNPEQEVTSAEDFEDLIRQIERMKEYFEETSEYQRLQNDIAFTLIDMLDEDSETPNYDTDRKNALVEKTPLENIEIRDYEIRLIFDCPDKSLGDKVYVIIDEDYEVEELSTEGFEYEE